MSDPVRIAATGDLHYTKHCRGRLADLFVEASRQADLLCITGDLTDYGLEEEMTVLVQDLEKHLSIPCVAVLGNHDYEGGHAEVLGRQLDAAGVHLLDGESVEIRGVHLAGVPGFGGGFDARMLNAWGEPLIKAFVQEAVDHSVRLEKALSRLESDRKVALTHYAPVRATVVGEDPEIFAYLGSSRLEGPLNRQSVRVAFHGHAHNGAPEGRTSAGIPVYNVALPGLRRANPDGPGFRVVEV